jgi:hypothetical protein
MELKGNKMETFKHQGDVTFTEVDSLPVGAKEVFHTGEFILALGEITGHKHKASSETMQVYMNGEDIFLISVDEEIEITHEEHFPIVLPKHKIIKIGREQEKDWFELVVRAVND